MRLALAQINPTVGDLAGNEALIRRDLAAAREAGAQLVVFPELALSSYALDDLLLQTALLDAVEEALGAITAGSADLAPVLLVGAPLVLQFQRFSCAEGGADGVGRVLR